jgi:hypothetical protein
MPKTPGFETVIGDADFGKVSALLCFDANFPEVWRDVALRGADIVFFLSAYSAGRQLAAHALNNHYYIISCTMFPDFSVFNITGNEIHYSGGVKKDLLVSRAVIDTDKVICHTNFNEEKIKKMLEENPGVIEIEQFYEREQWYVFRSPCKGSVTKDICKKYEIENLRDYQNRSRAYINTKRKYPIKWMKEKP